mgnify:CR=1 FL=1
MSELETLKQAVLQGKLQDATDQTRVLMESAAPAQSIIDDALIAAMDEVGEKFSKGQLFVPQMLRSAKAMQECMNILKPQLKEGDVTPKGKVVIGTVKGDLHDIGKNLVAMMMEGAGFTIIDLGVDVAPDRFAQTVQEEESDILALSALLSTTMPSMPATIEALTRAGVRDKVKVMIGGAPVTEKYSREIQADTFAPDAGAAVAAAKKLLGS